MNNRSCTINWGYYWNLRHGNEQWCYNISRSTERLCSGRLAKFKIVHEKVWLWSFGDKCTNMIMTLYKSGQSCVSSNRFVLDFFPISRSMRQGYPIERYLYILQAQPIAQSIGENKTIQGIPLPSHDENHRTESKISMFVDFCV